MSRFLFPRQSVSTALRNSDRTKYPSKRRLRFERLEMRAMLSVNGDFNGDGFDDLAIGTPFETVSGQPSAGAVYAMYGSSGSGLVSAGAQRWTQNTGIVLGISQANDHFGIALATGDYDGDRRADLAIGVERDVIGGIQSGAVNVLYGFLPGLIDVSNQLWHQGLLSSTDGNENLDLFGSALG